MRLRRHSALNRAYKDSGLFQAVAIEGHECEQAAGAELQASVENRREVLVTLAAEVARNYTELRSYQQRLAIAKRNLASQQRSAHLSRQRFEGGFVNGLDLANADALVATTEAQMPLLESSAKQTIFVLSVLLDREPGALVEALAEADEIPAAPPQVPIGVPADLLCRRPDIRQAEAQIHAATARIGVASAPLYPRVAINGSLGRQAANAGDLFNPLSRFWSFGPSVTWNLFEGGRTASNIELQKALQEQSILSYRKMVLTAIQEVEDALIASTKEQEHRKSLQAAVTSNRKAAELATQFHTGGLTDFLNVLSAQRSLYASEDALAQSSQAKVLDLIALYKALGGAGTMCWQSPAGKPGKPSCRPYCATAWAPLTYRGRWRRGVSGPPRHCDGGRHLRRTRHSDKSAPARVSGPARARRRLPGSAGLHPDRPARTRESPARRAVRRWRRNWQGSTTPQKHTWLPSKTLIRQRSACLQG